MSEKRIIITEDWKVNPPIVQDDAADNSKDKVEIGYCQMVLNFIASIFYFFTFGMLRSAVEEVKT